MSNRKRRTEPYKAGDRVVISERYRGAVGPKIHGKPGVVAKVSYPKRGAKFVFVQLDGESDLSQVLTFADELDREPKSLEDKITEWAADPEGNRLVQAIHDRQGNPELKVAAYRVVSKRVEDPTRDVRIHTETDTTAAGTAIHVYETPKNPKAGDTVRYLGYLGSPIPRDDSTALPIRQEGAL